MTDVERERYLDHRVRLALAVDRRYTNAADPEAQAIAEELIETEQELELMRATPAFLRTFGDTARYAELTEQRERLERELADTWCAL